MSVLVNAFFGLLLTPIFLHCIAFGAVIGVIGLTVYILRGPRS